MAHPIGIGIIGYGKIAQDQHVPAIAANPALALAGVASLHHPPVPGVPHWAKTPAALLRDCPGLDAVAICTQPQIRHQLARDALDAGKHVMLEKPPAATVAELHDLARLAAAKGLTLFTAWHSQHNEAVARARALLAGQTIASLHIEWKEDVHEWHPGQKWIWEAGGCGVFDPGINALSILTRILPEPVFLRSAELLFPADADAPIAANLVFGLPGPERRLTAAFDWRQKGPPSWDILIETEAGTSLKLSRGGRELTVDGTLLINGADHEYPLMYRHFAELLGRKTSDIDEQPFVLVADAFMIGRRIGVEAVGQP
jgi:D-galactose 1-dehydrogenase